MLKLTSFHGRDCSCTVNSLQQLTSGTYDDTGEKLNDYMLFWLEKVYAEQIFDYWYKHGKGKQAQSA